MTVTRVRRSFAAAPVRRAATTWEAIVDVVAPDGSSGRAELIAVSGIAASLIAAEAWPATPLIFSQVGPQLRIYTLHGEDAIVGDGINEDSLAWSPTEGDWALEMPCPHEDVEWVAAAAAEISTRLTVVDATVRRATETTEVTAGITVGEIDTEAFLRG
ncbi:MAG: hypothetical protein ACLP8S_17690 [Solirubrobacteraceae bacterium]